MSELNGQFYRKNFYYFYDIEKYIKQMFEDEHLFPPGTIEDFYKLYV